MSININNQQNQDMLNNQNNLNQNNINQENINQNNQYNQKKNNMEEFKKFVGISYPKNGHTECSFCGLYFLNEMKIGDSCGHCWAFCFNTQLNLQTFKYDGPHTTDEVKNYLKKTFSLHPKNCANSECIYHKINQFHKEKKLDNELATILGLEIKSSDEKKKSSIVTKKRDLNINFKLSSISI